MDTVEITWPPSALSPNSRCHWRVKAKAGKYYKREVYYLCKAANLIVEATGKVHLSVNFYPPSRHVIDQDNAVASLKYAQDSIAEYLKMNDRDFIPHYFYHGFQEDFKGKVVVKIIPDTDIKK
jgi:crossover junction endodeoxyribonuclease RusA